jgi:uncharacterized FlaG/YvyC family protein
MTGEDKRELITGYVNLRDHLEALWREREKRLEDRFNSIVKILEATAKEMAHRLEVLNHAHEQSVADRTELQSASEFKTFKADLDKWQGVVNNAITTFNTRYEFRINAATWISIVSLVLGIGSLVALLLKK